MQDPAPRWKLDLDDPRAPTDAQWEAMTAAERAQVIASLPAWDSTGEFQPEGDAHRKAKESARESLETFFQRTGRKVYVSSELNVFYPGERKFMPDVLAVLDVEPGERSSWIVQAEGKGLDFVLEVHTDGDVTKDYTRNVAWFARLGIREYFVFDAHRARLVGYRLEGERARTYSKIVPQSARWASHVLGLELAVDGKKIRFWLGNAPLSEAAELSAKLEGMVDALLARAEDAEVRIAKAEQRAEEEARRAEEEARRAEEEARRAEEEARRAEERAEHARAVEAQLREALAELDRLRKRG